MEEKKIKNKKSYLNKISAPEDLKGLSVDQLKELAEEIRTRLIDVTSKKGGHLAASLGVVDLTVALHYCLDAPTDKIIWDVGHQSYAHKILTGRNKQFDTLREMGGLSGFPNTEESIYDTFTCGHSATSISSALGLVSARDLKGEDYKVISVIGDASLASGLAFEGMNHAGHMKKNMVVILNDNEHSISKPVGALSRYLNKVLTHPVYNKVVSASEKVVKNIPKVGESAYNTVRKFQEGVKNLFVPGIFFEELGFRYFGPIDGHDIDQLIQIFNSTFSLKEPIFIHVITKKGKGYNFAEENPTLFHGVSLFDIETGSFKKKKEGKGFTEILSEKIVELGIKDKKIVAITAAMSDGTGLTKFAEKFPHRFFDVGITEPHAVTFSAGLARDGLKPIVAIYSTFMQRAYDQLIHDVALQKLPVIFCLDRAGLVGKDGPTHHGVFDLAYMRTLPNFVVMAPKDGYEFERMLEKAVTWGKPVAIRYPRAEAKELIAPASSIPVDIGKAELLRRGKDGTILAIGSMVNTAIQVSEILSRKGIEVTVVNMRFAKPLDKIMIEEVCAHSKRLVTLEEGIITGGFGSSILEFLDQENITGIKVKCLGLPDQFIEHGTRDQLLRKYHLTPEEIALTIEKEL